MHCFLGYQMIYLFQHSKGEPMNQKNTVDMTNPDPGAERKEPPAAGVFDQNKQPGTTDTPLKGPEKTAFKSPHTQHAEMISERVNKPNVAPVNESEAAANATNAALNNTGPGRNVEAELEELDKISEDDLKLAEKMIFDGFAETDVTMPNLPGHALTICSTSAEEANLTEEVIFGMVKKAEDLKDGTVDIPQSKIQSMRNALGIAIAYRGMDKKELVDDTSCYLNTIKKAVTRLSELENSGEMDDAKKLKDSLLKALIKRATAVQRLSTPLIDFLAVSKYEFDSKMYKIISSKQVLPKS